MNIVLYINITFYLLKKIFNFTEANPSKDATNILPHTKTVFIVPLCIINNNNFWVCKGAAYHSPL